MKKPRNKMKIGLSLLIAMMFVIQIAPVMANDPMEIEDASNERMVGNTQPAAAPTMANSFSNSPIAAAQMVNGEIIPIREGTTPPSTLTTGPDGCFPINVMSLSLDGEDLVEPVAISTGCYDVDMTVCKTEWLTCANDWYIVTTDSTQENLNGTTPYALQPLQIMAKCDLDNTWIQFRNFGTKGANNVTLGLVKIRIKGDLGWQTYTTDPGDTDPTKLYKGVNPIPGSVVSRWGGGAEPPSVVRIKIPRGTGYWSGCCDDIEWYYYVYPKFGPQDGSNMNKGGWMDDVCFGDFYPAEIKKFVEIYKYHSEEDPDETVEIYCTDFEDPCDIYANWATFDAPVWGSNGGIDTWTWSSRRSNSPDHSFHNSAFDTYLESQLDYLVLNAGGSGLDVAAYNEVEVCFSHWAEGDVIIDGDTTIIQDAGYVEYSFNGVTYIQATEEFFDTEGAWEDECFTVDTTGENNLWIRWVWYSDPTFCYEGWYIDDVCVHGVLEGSFDEWWELVWDTHSWPQEIIGECEEYTFELPWCVYQEGTYLICGWIQVLDECHFSDNEYYDPYCIEVEVGDILNVADMAVYTSPGCPVEEGTDVSIFSDICNVGTLDATDVQVKVTVQRGFIDTIIDTEFDCAVDEVHLADAVADPDYGDYWFQSAVPGRSEWHFTDFEDGECYLANFDESAGNKFPLPGPRTTEWVASPYIFQGSDRGADCTVIFDAAWALPDPANNHWHIAVMDDSSGYLYYFSVGNDGLSNGNGDYVHFEEGVSSLIQSLYSAGHTTDADTDLSFMIFMFKDSSDNSITPPLTWSGIKIDNFRMDKLVAVPEPIIFTETVIVPYLNVSDCTTVEFDWDDVGVGQYVITEEILTEDDDMSDNKQVTTCNVYNIFVEAEDLYCVDHTDGIPGDWVLEGCCGGVYWAGDPATTAYGNDWDTSLYIAPDGNATLDFSTNTTINLDFDTWYQLAANDVGYVETTFDGLHWNVIATYTGDSINPPENWEAYSLGIPNNVIGIRFRFVSNETEINRGWMIDNIVITTDGYQFFEADGTSMNDFVNLQTAAGCWWFDSFDTQWFTYDTSQLFWNATIPWFPDGYLEPSWGVFDPDYFNLGLTGNLFPDDIDTSLVWEFSVPKAFYGWIAKSTYYDLPNNPNVTANLEISIDGGANWEELEKYVGSANYDYYGGAIPLWYVVGRDWQYWESNNVPITDYLTADDIMIRWHMVSIADLDFIEYAGFGPLTDGTPIAFYGMSDLVAPFTTITMEGTFDETYGYYTSEVAVWLTATDDITGVAAIYYELDGTQYTYTGPFIIDGDGEHTLCYWSVDNEGNVEEKKCIAPFKIDGTGPSIEISIADGPGIYLFGKKLMSSEKYIFLFGGVDVKATVSVSGAPLQTVEFYMNDELFGEDTSAPFQLKCTLKNQGSATFKVVAKDVLGKTASASQTVDTYIKLL